MLRSDIELSDASPCRMLHVGMLACEHVKGEGERVACCMSHVARRMLIVACLHVACRMSHAARRMLYTSGMLSVTPCFFFRVLHVACRMSHVARCMSHVARVRDLQSDMQKQNHGRDAQHP